MEASDAEGEVEMEGGVEEGAEPGDEEDKSGSSSSSGGGGDDDNGDGDGEGDADEDEEKASNKDDAALDNVQFWTTLTAAEVGKLKPVLRKARMQARAGLRRVMAAAKGKELERLTAKLAKLDATDVGAFERAVTNPEGPEARDPAVGGFVRKPRWLRRLRDVVLAERSRPASDKPAKPFIRKKKKKDTKKSPGKRERAPRRDGDDDGEKKDRKRARPEPPPKKEEDKNEPAALHPSWEARRAQKAKLSALPAFQGVRKEFKDEDEAGGEPRMNRKARRAMQRAAAASSSSPSPSPAAANPKTEHQPKEHPSWSAKSRPELRGSAVGFSGSRVEFDD